MSEVIATREEMKDFLSSINIQIRYEKGKEDKHHNLVVYFTPFPEKYINYIKKNNPSYNHFNGKKDYGNSTIYVGLCIRRRGAGHNMRYRFRKTTYLRRPNNMIKNAIQGEYEGQKIEYYRYNMKKSDKWIFPVSYKDVCMGLRYKFMSPTYSLGYKTKFYKYMRRVFLLPLTPTEAARGYKIFFDIFNRTICPLPNNDGVCAYILGAGDIYWSSNCLRGWMRKKKSIPVSLNLTSHPNPCYFSKINQTNNDNE